MFVDIDSGTILNGPMYRLPPTADIPDGASDSEAIDIALETGADVDGVIEDIGFALTNYEGGVNSPEKTLSIISALVADYENGTDV